MLTPEDQLANEWYQEHLIDTGEIIYAEACSFCDRTYVPQDLTGQFCSDKCRVTHIRRSSWDVLTPIYSEAINILGATGRTVAANELKEAMQDIFRRPHPDITGAIQHANAGLEAVARDVTGNPTSTLGVLVQSLPIPDDLKEAVRKLWRYSSENARHGREGNDPAPTDAKLVVTVASAVSTFLVERHNSSQR